MTTRPITPEVFLVKTGRPPTGDDMDRVNCEEAGESGHHQCGWCDKHDKPRFMCACLLWNDRKKA
jgi:hypothetical protein